MDEKLYLCIGKPVRRWEGVHHPKHTHNESVATFTSHYAN